LYIYIYTYIHIYVYIYIYMYICIYRSLPSRQNAHAFPFSGGSSQRANCTSSTRAPPPTALTAEAVWAEQGWAWPEAAAPAPVAQVKLVTAVGMMRVKAVKAPVKSGAPTASNVTASYLQEEEEERDTRQVLEFLKSRRVEALQKNAQELLPRRKIWKEAHKKEAERRGVVGAVRRREERGREKKRGWACLAE
jgi:hypothetical protein